MNVLIRQIDSRFSKEEMTRIGFDCAYIDAASKKYDYRLFKIFGLAPHQATIIKQTALSLGSDAAVHRDVLMCKIDSSDVLLGGSVAQIISICDKLKKQPFSLAKIAFELEAQIFPTLTPMKIRNRLFDFEKKTFLMGILNVTPDSFSDGGKYFEKDTALLHAKELIVNSDIVDIGAESTRPGAEPIDCEEEMRRLIPIVEGIRQIDDSIPISIDTRNAKTARAALEAGADMINDISGLSYDSSMADVIRDYGVPVVLMHSENAINMQTQHEYKRGVVDDVFFELEKKIDFASSCGIDRKNIILDVGIGFDKTYEENLELIRRMDEFFSLGCPLLAGVSRKSVIKKIAGEDISSRDEATLAMSAYLASKKINILRVHNVSIHRKSIELVDELVRR